MLDIQHTVHGWGECVVTEGVKQDLFLHMACLRALPLDDEYKQHMELYLNARPRPIQGL